MYIYIHIYIYTHIYREREGERSVDMKAYQKTCDPSQSLSKFAYRFGQASHRAINQQAFCIIIVSFFGYLRSQLSVEAGQRLVFAVESRNFPNLEK